MAVVPVKIPPGVFRNGTRYQAKGRWHSANRIRWHNGSMRPIGGWSRKRATDTEIVMPDIVPDGEVARDGHAWRDNVSDQYTVWGTNARVMWQKATGVGVDLGPANLVPGPIDAGGSGARGYGTGLYGRGDYGVPSVSTDLQAVEVGRWKFDNWGQNLLAAPLWDEAGARLLYEWDVSGSYLVYNVTFGIGDGTPEGDIVAMDYTAQPGAVGACAQNDGTQAVYFLHNGSYYRYDGASVSIGTACGGTVDAADLVEVAEPSAGLRLIDEAPVDFEDFIITDERMCMVIGAGSELRRVEWCDRENLRDWDYNDITNTAGFFVLPGSGRLIGIYKLKGEYLILTETDAWSVRYVGAPYIYHFEQIGTQCPPIFRNAYSLLPNGALVWLGLRTFWMYDGAIKVLPSDLIDFLRQDLDLTRVSKVFTWINSEYNEVWFHYPSAEQSATEPYGYVTWNWENNTWSQGRMVRTAAIGSGVYYRPQMLDYDGVTWWHEVQDRVYDDGGQPLVKSGPIEMKSGERNTAVRWIMPDAQIGNWRSDGLIQPAPVNFYFEYRQTPYGNLIRSADYTYTADLEQPIPTTGIMGRDIMLTLFGDPGDGINTTWEWGEFRMDVAQAVGQR